MPWYPSEEEDSHGFTVTTNWEKLVADYARISLFEVEELDYLLYLQLRRDAFITKLQETRTGNEYLTSAWRLSRTDNDRQKSRALFGLR